jgi:hypothetical protein
VEAALKVTAPRTAHKEEPHGEMALAASGRTVAATVAKAVAIEVDPPGKTARGSSCAWIIKKGDAVETTVDTLTTTEVVWCKEAVWYHKEAVWYHKEEEREAANEGKEPSITGVAEEEVSNGQATVLAVSHGEVTVVVGSSGAKERVGSNGAKERVGSNGAKERAGSNGVAIAVEASSGEAIEAEGHNGEAGGAVSSMEVTEGRSGEVTGEATEEATEGRSNGGSRGSHMGETTGEGPARPDGKEV